MPDHPLLFMIFVLVLIWGWGRSSARRLAKIRPDPRRECLVYLHDGCSHIDGPCCDVRTCSIRLNVNGAITPQAIEVFGCRKGDSVIKSHDLIKR